MICDKCGETLYDCWLTIKGINYCSDCWSEMDNPPKINIVTEVDNDST